MTTAKPGSLILRQVTRFQQVIEGSLVLRVQYRIQPVRWYDGLMV